ncbi:hypothetical protein [Endozoicomonas numazuensis]|uniref:Uncharacterized protein n=1 Tax=Endozoicomonas numazuensis TaxID=1137799 RepID=A0A081NLV6_9GAMM|nr:hypothetical protein [Endozoicomonas numazuensis]KEQ19429.1 hypothetical protein GZ78_05635 [Endozoicomonas numazuensis]
MLNVNNTLIIAVLSLVIVAVVSFPELLLIILPVAAFFSLQQWFEHNTQKPARIKAEVHPQQKREQPHERR